MYFKSHYRVAQNSPLAYSLKPNKSSLRFKNSLPNKCLFQDLFCLSQSEPVNWGSLVAIYDSSLVFYTSWPVVLLSSFSTLILLSVLFDGFVLSFLWPFFWWDTILDRETNCLPHVSHVNGFSPVNWVKICQNVF